MKFCFPVVPLLVGVLPLMGALQQFWHAMRMTPEILGCHDSAFRLPRSQWLRVSSEAVTDMFNRCHGWI